MNKELEIARKIWKFFVTAHPDSDLEAIVDLIMNETRKITLLEVAGFAMGSSTRADDPNMEWIRFPKEKWQEIQLGTLSNGNDTAQ